MICKGHVENCTEIHSQNRLAHTQTKICFAYENLNISRTNLDILTQIATMEGL